jgi:hypothetical protein
MSGVLASGCADVAPEDETGDDSQAITVEGEYSFRHEFPANRLFERPFTKAFTIDVERDGIKVHTTITPTVKLAVTSPVVEGKVTVGRRGRIFFRTPKILDAEIRASSTYSANLTVDLDVKWNNTTRIDVMRQITRELEAKLNGGKALELASKLGETNIPIKDAQGNVRSDIPLKGHYDVAVTCSFEEIDGDLQGKFESGARGTVVARAVYNSEGVERRRFRRDPTKKFELDTSDFTVDPQPNFRFTGFRQHVKGSCAVQPSIVVTFDNGVGASLRVAAESSFDTQIKAQAGEAVQWEFRAKPKLSIWGETDILLPLVHHNLNTEKLLFARDFSEVRREIAAPAASPDPGPSDPGEGPVPGCFSYTLQKTLPELSCVQSRSNQLWFQCKAGEWFRGGDSSAGPYGTCTSSHPL